jgi:hypothetical protein
MTFLHFYIDLLNQTVSHFYGKLCYSKVIEDLRLKADAKKSDFISSESLPFSRLPAAIAQALIRPLPECRAPLLRPLAS